MRQNTYIRWIDFMDTLDSYTRRPKTRRTHAMTHAHHWYTRQATPDKQLHVVAKFGAAW